MVQKPERSGIPVTSKETYRSRGGRTTSSKFRYRIGDREWTAAEIAARLQISNKVAMNRLRREQAKPDAVTWDGMSKP